MHLNKFYLIFFCCTPILWASQPAVKLPTAPATSLNQSENLVALNKALDSVNSLIEKTPSHTIADTAYVLATQLHTWAAQDPEVASTIAKNQKIYCERLAAELKKESEVHEDFTNAMLGKVDAQVREGLEWNDEDWPLFESTFALSVNIKRLKVKYAESAQDAHDALFAAGSRKNAAKKENDRLKARITELKAKSAAKK